MEMLDTVIAQRVLSFLSPWAFLNFTAQAFTMLLLTSFMLILLDRASHHINRTQSYIEVHSLWFSTCLALM